MPISQDGLRPVDVLRSELRQREESGFLVEDLRMEVAAVAEDDVDRIEQLLVEVEHAPSGPWSYEEPEGLPAIVDTMPSPDGDARLAPDPDRILGAWLGRVAGNMVGKPVENGDVWTPARIRAHLERHDAYPLLDYVPGGDGPDERSPLLPNWTETTRGRVAGSSRDDDVDYTVLGLQLLEQHGDALTPADAGRAWLTRLPILQTYTAERAAYRNLVDGLLPPSTATFRNPYREWIGALIRADVFGYTRPGAPRAAAVAAYQDAALSHTGNGVYGEMWAAALVAAAFDATSAEEALVRSLQHVPPRSRLAEAIAQPIDAYAQGDDWATAVDAIHARWAGYSWVHTVNNAGVIAAALLWGGSDVARTIGLTVQGGLDTDSNGATVGSVLGALHGARDLPPHLIDPLEDRLSSAIFGSDGSAISALAARTVTVAQRLRD